jgi:hypothetical protein
MDLRAGAPADEGRTRSRSLRRPILAGPASSCAHDHDRLRLPPVSPAHGSQAGKKESTGRRLNRLCQPCARPFSNSSLGHHHSDAHTAENGFATSDGVSKSAKVVLGRVLINRGRWIRRAWDASYWRPPHRSLLAQFGHTAPTWGMYRHFAIFARRAVCVPAPVTRERSSTTTVSMISATSVSDSEGSYIHPPITLPMAAPIKMVEVARFGR